MINFAIKYFQWVKGDNIFKMCGFTVSLTQGDIMMLCCVVGAPTPLVV